MNVHHVSFNDQLRDTQLTTLWIARIDYTRNSGVNPHVHDAFYQLLIVMEGEGEIEVAGTRHRTQGGHYCLFPQNQPHGFNFSSDSVTIDIKFKVHDQGLERLINEQLLYGKCDQDDLTDIKHWFSLSLQNANKPQPLLPYRIDSGFKGTLLSIIQKAHLASAAGTGAVNSRKLKRDFPMAEFIHRNIAEKITLDDIAKHFGFHPHYLIKLFSDHTGMSPIQYLQEARLEKAKEYLEQNELSVSEISEQLGWTNSYFSRLFKQREGVSPSQYRKNVTSAIGKDIVLEQAFENEWQIISF